MAVALGRKSLDSGGIEINHGGKIILIKQIYLGNYYTGEEWWRS